MATVIPDVVGLLSAILDTSYTATDRGLSRVVLPKLTGVRQYSLEELYRHNFHSIV